MVPVQHADREISNPSAWRGSTQKWLLLSLLGVAILGLPSLLYPFPPDQAMFAYIGDRWLHGELPYRDAWDLKPPGIFGVFAAAQVIFGRGMAAARWADLFATLMAAGGLFVLAKRRDPGRVAIFAPLIFGLIYFNCFEYQDSAQSESFAAPFTVLYFLCLIRSRDRRGWGWPVLAGLTLGSMVLLKTAFVMFIVLAPIAYWPRELADDTGKARLLKMFALLCGLSAPLAATAVYFWSRGALGELSNLLAAQKAYSTVPSAEALARSGRSIVRFFHERPALLVLCLAVTVSFFSPYRKRVPGLYWAWLGVAAGIVTLQWRCHSYHFLVLLPPLALIGGSLCARLRLFAESSPRREVGPSACLFLLLLFLIPVALGMRRFGLAASVLTGTISRDSYWACFNAPGWYPFENSVNVANFVREHTVPSDHILVYDYDPAIYYLSERACPTRHLSNEPIIGAQFYPAALREAWRKQQIYEITNHPPRLLVVAVCPHCHGMASEHEFAPKRIHFAADDYELLTSITKDRIYRRLPRRVTVQVGMTH